MKNNPLAVGDHMTPAPQTIGADQKIDTALKLMNDLGIRHLPVLKAGKLVGLVSERDIRLVEALEGVDPRLILVADIMVPDPYTAPTTAPLKEVVAEMAKHKYGSVIVTKDEKAAGILTSVDAMKILADLL